MNSRVLLGGNWGPAASYSIS